MNRIKNIVTKGESVNHEQFLLLPQCFKNESAVESAERLCMWENAKVGFPGALLISTYLYLAMESTSP